MEGQKAGVGWSLACASADRESAEEGMGEVGLDFEGVLRLGATFAWRSSKLIALEFSVTLFPVKLD